MHLCCTLYALDTVSVSISTLYNFLNSNVKSGFQKNVNKFLVCMNPSLIKHYFLDSATLYLNKGNSLY